MGKIIESAAERFGLPGELAGLIKLTLTGNGHILAENHRGLLEYSDECIVLAGGRLRVRIKGQGLHLLAMDGCSMVIKGKVLGVDME